MLTHVSHGIIIVQGLNKILGLMEAPALGCNKEKLCTTCSVLCL